MQLNNFQLVIGPAMIKDAAKFTDGVFIVIQANPLKAARDFSVVSDGGIADAQVARERGTQGAARTFAIGTNVILST